MLPNTNLDIRKVSNSTQISYTYKLDLENKRIIGKVDNEDAIMQAIIKIMNTERYAYPIYSDKYGVELERIIGKDYVFVSTAIKKSIEEALLSDDRILSIENFEIEKTGIDKMQLSFRVKTLEGYALISQEVHI